MSRIILAFPTKFFHENFAEKIMENGSDINGSDLPLYLKDEVNTNGRLFSPNIDYKCKIVNDNVTLVGTSNV